MINQEHKETDEDILRISFSALDCYNNCKERYRKDYLIEQEILDEDDIQLSDSYYAAVGTAIQKIFEDVVNLWNSSDETIEASEDNFNLLNLKGSYYNTKDFEAEKFYNQLFEILDSDINLLKDYIIGNKITFIDNNHIRPEIAGNIITSFRFFYVELSRYGNIIYVARNKFAKEVKTLYKAPLIRFINTILSERHIDVQCEVRFNKQIATHARITGSADFVVKNNTDNIVTIYDGKRLYNPETNDKKQLVLYAMLLKAQTIGFICYKTDKVFKFEVTEEDKQEVKDNIKVMYQDVRQWDLKQPKTETVNSKCIYCDWNETCETYLKFVEDRKRNKDKTVELD